MATNQEINEEMARRSQSGNWDGLPFDESQDNNSDSGNFLSNLKNVIANNPYLKTLVTSTETGLKDLAAGGSEFLQNINKFGSEILPKSIQNTFPNTGLGKTDPYGLLGIEKQPWNTFEGIRQAIPSMMAPGGPEFKGLGALTGPVARGLGNVGMNALYGAASNQENRERGAEAGGIGAALLQSIPIAGQYAKNLLPWAAEHLNPIQWVRNFTDNLNKIRNDSESYTNKIYNNTKSQHGNIPIEASTHIEDANSQINPSTGFSPDLEENEINQALGKHGKDALEKFNNDPTLKNAINLQSTYGKQTGFVNKDLGELGYRMRQFLMNARKSLRDPIIQQLKNVNPKAAEDYLNADKVYSSTVLPLKHNDEIKLLTSDEYQNGKYKPRSLESVQKTLEDIYESPEYKSSIVNNPESELGNQYNIINQKLTNKNFSDKLASILGTLGTGIGAHYLTGDVGSSLPLAAAGGVATHFSPSFIQNPKAQNVGNIAQTISELLFNNLARAKATHTENY